MDSFTLSPKHVALFNVKDNVIEGKVIGSTATKLTLEVNKDGDTINMPSPKTLAVDVGIGSILTFNTLGVFISADNSNVKVKAMAVESDKAPRSPVWSRPNN